MAAKPRIRLTIVRPEIPKPLADKVAEARRRFGKPFAHEPNSPTHKRSTPLLLEWLATRKRP